MVFTLPIRPGSKNRAAEPFACLSVQEAAALAMAAVGLENHEIARRLSLEPSGVRNVFYRVRLRVGERTERGLLAWYWKTLARWVDKEAAA